MPLLSNSLFVVQHQTFEMLIERGEKLDDLVSKSEDLSSQSKLFYQTVSNASFWYILFILVQLSIFEVGDNVPLIKPH